MRDISFFSDDKYLYLPSANNPRVILAITNKHIAKQSFKLYNPFSSKGKILKQIAAFLVVNFNGLSSLIFNVKKQSKSEFILYLENQLQTKLMVSIYNATAKDKVVLQLQTGDEVLGYLKFPLNQDGVRNINIEKRAIELLSKKGIVPLFIKSDTYNNLPFLIIPELKGEIKNQSNAAIEDLAQQFKKETKQHLKTHKRILQLYADVATMQLHKYKPIIDDVVSRENRLFYEAYEHGDFAPWNIIETKKGLVPFDFDFFIEDGIEHFDVIKYHFQVGRLLKKKNNQALLDYINDNIDIENIESLISLFLIKEIIRLKKINETYQFQDDLLNFTSAKTT